MKLVTTKHTKLEVLNPDRLFKTEELKGLVNNRLKEYGLHLYGDYNFYTVPKTDDTSNDSVLYVRTVPLKGGMHKEDTHIFKFVVTDDQKFCVFMLSKPEIIDIIEEL